MRPIFRTFGLILFFAAATVCPRCELLFPMPESEPVVLTVEPPNWWAGHSINPVRLLIRGRNLAGARVTSTTSVLKAGPVRVSEAGTSLFVEVTIDAAAPPGPCPLRITTDQGGATAPFEISPALPATGRFQGFSQDDVIYLIMPDRFANGDTGNDDPAISRGMWNRKKSRYYHGGDLRGIKDHLSYLKDLGITALWVTPVYDNVNHLNERERYGGEAITDYHGYGAVDYYSVEEHFGDMAVLRELVDEAHRLGIKVIQDQVANHTGPYHPWVQDPPTPTWYHGTAANHLNETWQTWTLMDPHATPQIQQSTLDGWFVNILPDLNQSDAETSRYIIQNSLWWVGMAGFDGIRQDTLPYVPRSFWRDWMAALKRQYPHLTVVGEVFDADPALVAFFQGGREQFDGIDTGVDALFDFPLFYPLRRAFAQGKPLRDVAAMLGHDGLYKHPEMLVTFLGLHDVARFMNEPGADVRGLEMAFTFLMTSRGIPMIYYGDEIGLPGGGDPDNRRDFPGGWPEDPKNAFSPAGRTPDQQEIFEHLRRLARLRAELEPLRRGRSLNLAVDEQFWVYARVTDHALVIVALNNAQTPAVNEFPVSPLDLREGTVLWNRLGGSADVTVSGGRARIILPARSAAIYAIR